MNSSLVHANTCIPNEIPSSHHVRPRSPRTSHRPTSICRALCRRSTARGSWTWVEPPLPQGHWRSLCTMVPWHPRVHLLLGSTSIICSASQVMWHHFGVMWHHFGSGSKMWYPLVIQHSYWKWPFIVSFLINSMVMFHSLVNVYQRVHPKKKWSSFLENRWRATGFWWYSCRWSQIMLVHIALKFLI